MTHKDDAVALCVVVIVGIMVWVAMVVNEDNRRRWRARRRARRTYTFTPPPRWSTSRALSRSLDGTSREEDGGGAKRQRQRGNDQMPVHSTMTLRVKPLRPRRNKTYGRKRPIFRTRVMLCKHNGTILRFRRDGGRWYRAKDNDPWNLRDSSKWDPSYQTWCERTRPLYSAMEGYWQTLRR